MASLTSVVSLLSLFLDYFLLLQVYQRLEAASNFN